MIKRFRVLFRDALQSLHRLALEMAGAFFVALAVLGVASTLDEYRRYLDRPDMGVWRLVLSLIFALVMLASAIHSFWKARKLRP